MNKYYTYIHNKYKLLLYTAADIRWMHIKARIVYTYFHTKPVLTWNKKEGVFELNNVKQIKSKSHAAQLTFINLFTQIDACTLLANVSHSSSSQKIHILLAIWRISVKIVQKKMYLKKNLTYKSQIMLKFFLIVKKNGEKNWIALHPRLFRMTLCSDLDYLQ